MNGLRVLAALITPPLIYGLICLPLSQWVLGFFPEAVSESGAVFDVGATFAIEAVQCVTLLICGASIAILSPSNASLNVVVALATAFMFAIALFVQYQYWDQMLIWHHFVFFTMVLILQPLGAAWYVTFRTRRMHRKAPATTPNT